MSAISSLLAETGGTENVPLELTPNRKFTEHLACSLKLVMLLELT